MIEMFMKECICGGGLNAPKVALIFGGLINYKILCYD